MFLGLTGVPLVLVSILAFVIILGLIIIVHEGGHFLFAKKAGILCHEFSIGMGPAIYKKKFKETTFCIRAIPIGGYVSMADDDISSNLVQIGDEIGLNFLDGLISEIVIDNTLDSQTKGKIVDYDLAGKDGNPLFITINDGFQDYYYEVMPDAFYVLKKDQKMQITPYNRSFDSKTLWQRFLVLAAGPVMNFILAIFIYLIVCFATGVPNYDSTVIGSVSDSNTGIISDDTTLIRPGDDIKKINDVSVYSWNDVSTELDKLLDTNQTKVDLLIVRDGQEVEVTVDCYTEIVSLGLSNFKYEKKDLPEGIVKGLIVGELNLRYLDDGNKGTYPIQKGDVITKVQYRNYVDNAFIDPVTVELTEWGQLVEIFKNIDVANVKFEYYSYEKNGIVTFDECAELQTYGNEVLENQRIDKIYIKIGIDPEMRFDFFASIGNAFVKFWDDFTLIFRTLGLLIAPSGVRQVGVQNLSSVVGIFDIIQSKVSTGFLSLMAFAAMISVNIGVMNLLPIPALDGGRIIFLIYELITRKKPSKKVENVLTTVFFILIMILFVFVTYNDILRMIRG